METGWWKRAGDGPRKILSPHLFRDLDLLVTERTLLDKLGGGLVLVLVAAKQGPLPRPFRRGSKQERLQLGLDLDFGRT